MKTGRSSSIPYIGSKKTAAGRESKPETAWYAGLLRKWERLKTGRNSNLQALRYDEYRLSVKEWAIYGAEGAAAAALVAYVFYRSVAVFLVLVPAGVCLPLLKRKELKQARLRKLRLEFKEGILILSSFLSAGYSVENAFSASEKELETLYGQEGMMAEEFAHMEGQIRMNRSAEAALTEFAERSGLDDVKNFAEVFAAAKRSGGELVSVISHTAGVIRDKVEVQEDIITMTASKQFEQKIMNLIPFVIVLYIDATSPGFFDAMYGTGIGRIIMTVCLAVYAAAYILAKRIMEIEV